MKPRLVWTLPGPRIVINQNIDLGSTCSEPVRVGPHVDFDLSLQGVQGSAEETPAGDEPETVTTVGKLRGRRAAPSI